MKQIFHVVLLCISVMLFGQKNAAPVTDWLKEL